MCSAAGCGVQGPAAEGRGGRAGQGGGAAGQVPAPRRRWAEWGGPPKGARPQCPCCIWPTTSTASPPGRAGRASRRYAASQPLQIWILAFGLGSRAHCLAALVAAATRMIPHPCARCRCNTSIEKALDDARAAKIVGSRLLMQKDMQLQITAESRVLLHSTPHVIDRLPWASLPAEQGGDCCVHCAESHGC